MANRRMMPPASGPFIEIINGRKYIGTVGSTIDVPDYDSYVLEANGWISTPGFVGATANRPVNPPVNTHFNDTTIGSVVTWDGKVWRHVQTGASS